MAQPGCAPRALGPAGVVIPERVMTKAPTAELKPDQKDEDIAALPGTGSHFTLVC